MIQIFLMIVTTFLENIFVYVCESRLFHPNSYLACLMQTVLLTCSLFFKVFSWLKCSKNQKYKTLPHSLAFICLA